jgi:hypothetical protein
MRRLSWLYPPAWRAVYGVELDELLEQTPFTWQTLLDVLRGALDARFHPQQPRGGAGMRRHKTPGRTICSFCGKGPGQVKKLVAGPGVFICDSCIHLANQILDEDGGLAGGSGPGDHWLAPTPARRGRWPAWSVLWEDIRRLWRAARSQPTWG